MEQKKPLLELICSAENTEGRLAKGFCLPAENEKQEKMAPGAVDGILMFHTPLTNGKETTGYKLLVRAVDLAAEGKEDEAVEVVELFCEKSQVLPLVDAIHEYIESKQDSLDPSKLMKFAIRLFSKGTKKEEVKFGLTLLEMFETESLPELKQFILNIAACDEFTLFTLHIMYHWRDGNQCIYETIKKVYGWGRIFAVLFLKPESAEIRSWLISQGVKNTVLPQYSALAITEKCDLQGFMKGSLTLEEFLGVIDIVAALLDEKAVPGISGIKDPKKFMESFDECLIQNAAALATQMTTAQKNHVDEVIKARSGR